MIARTVFLICVSIIVESDEQRLCSSGHFYKNNECQKCDPCYNMWMDKIKPEKNENLDFNSLEEDINKLENRLLNNAEKLANLNKAKTELVSYLKNIQSMKNAFSKDLDKMAAENVKYKEKLQVNLENIQYLEADRLKLAKESESKPAADNSGYIQQIDKAEDDVSKASVQQNMAKNAIEDIETSCSILKEFNEESWKDRINEQQNEFAKLGSQYDDLFSKMNTEIPCENKLCSRNSTCRICKDFTTCYENDMFEFAVDLLQHKLEDLGKLTNKSKARIPSLEYELNEIETQNELVQAVFDSIKSPEKNIVIRINEFLHNLAPDNIDFYKSILELKLNKDDAYIKKLASNIRAVTMELNKLFPGNITDYINKSKTLVENSSRVNDNIQFISETINSVKGILRGENDDTNEDNNSFKYFLLELGEIINEIERRYEKLLNKKRRVIYKLNKLEELSARANEGFDSIWHLWSTSKQKSIDIQIKSDNEFKIFKKIDDKIQELDVRNKTVANLFQRINELVTRSDYLVEKIQNVVPNYDYNANILETEIIELQETMDDILETVKNKSNAYQKCT